MENENVVKKFCCYLLNPWIPILGIKRKCFHKESKICHNGFCIWTKVLTWLNWMYKRSICQVTNSLLDYFFILWSHLNDMVSATMGQRNLTLRHSTHSETSQLLADIGAGHGRSDECSKRWGHLGSKSLATISLFHQSNDEVLIPNSTCQPGTPGLWVGWLWTIYLFMKCFVI